MRILVCVFCLSVFASCLPPSDPYPYEEPSTVIDAATEISDNLEDYIIDWLDGNAAAEIPDDLIPAGIADSENFYLKNPDEVSSAETWATRLARPIDQDALLAGVPDPQVTYLFLGTAFAPFGSKLVIEGEFPYARFFSLQITAPIDGKSYYADRQFGSAEVSVVDADIDPLPGHTNPFRLGADRNADNRSYRMEFELTTGDPVALNSGAFEYPYRGSNNNLRRGALLVHQGPLGFKTIAQQPVPTPGDWNLGALWLRIYLPDADKGPLGGVPMPKVHFELPDGRRYFIGSDFSRLQERADLTSPNQVKESAPNPNHGPAMGWFKSWGITNSILSGISIANGWTHPDTARRVREIELGWTGRGENQDAPHNYEPHATTNNYVNYLGRPIDIPRGKVAVLTGKLPTFPDTRGGAATLEAAQVRYWSITGIDQDPLSPLPAAAIHSIGDQDVIIDEDRNYVIVYSHPDDRPANAAALNGVTWVNSGTQTAHGLLMRWLTVRDGWWNDLSPSEDQLNWANSDWAGTQYDSTLIGVNWRQGHMECFLPRVHLLDRADFDALGNNVSAGEIPVWVDAELTIGPAESRLGVVSASSVLNAEAASQVENAIDGDLTTAWSSAFGESEAAITVDLDSTRTISAVKLFWDFLFFARSYVIDYSLDGENWTNYISVSNQDGLVDLYDKIQNVQARYLRVTATEANLSWYSLVEFEVYTSDCDCQPDVISAVEEQQGSIDLKLEIPIEVFPVPARSHVEFSLPETYRHELIEYALYDTQGRLIKRVNYTGNNRMERGDLPAGVFLLEFRGVDWRVTRRVVLE